MSGARSAELAGKVAAWIGSARWFAGKDGATPQVSIHDLAMLADGRHGLALADTPAGEGVGDAGTIRSVVPLDLATGLDRAATPACAGSHVRLALAGGETHGDRGCFVGRPIGGRSRPYGPGGTDWGKVTVAPLGADASNTSLRVDTLAADGRGKSVALKLLRRCRPGVNPEVECGRFFAEDADWHETPRCLGWVEYRPADAASPADRVAIATIHSFEPGCRSLWEHCLALVAEGGLDGPHRDTLRRIACSLGQVTARMHAALASRPDLPDFAPRPATAATRGALAKSLASHARDRLAHAVDAAPGLRERARLEAIGRSSGRIVAAIETVAFAGTSAADIRLHGDYHLGQVLIDTAGTRLLPIDFEGEPGRSLAERRSPGSVCKDVAGMCRSFDYFSRVAAGGGGADGGAAVDRPRADAGPLIEAFLTAYRESAQGAFWWPADPSESQRLLDAFMLDKAVYELAYEMANRPDWIDVPLSALEQWLTGER